MKPLSEDQVELIVAAVLGAALFGILIGYSLENGWFGIIIWALIGAVVVSGALFIVFGLFASASLAASRCRLAAHALALMPSSPRRFPAPWSAEVQPNYGVTRMGNRLRTSIMSVSREGDLRPSYSAKMRQEGLQRTLLSCQSSCEIG